MLYSGLKDDNLVQKSRPLLLMRSVPFDLGELKILDTYLSRINSRDENSKAVTFTKREYETLMGLSEMRVEQLKKYTKSMLGKVAEVPLDKKNFSQIVLFSKADYIKDEKTGDWTITLICSEPAKKVFFGIEDIGYIRYRLKNVIAMGSKYSVLLYLYLIDNQYRSPFTVAVSELREKVFRCGVELYKEFKFFNQNILKKAVCEINEKTDLHVSYSTIKKGKTILKVEFEVRKKTLIQAVYEDGSEQLPLPMYTETDVDAEIKYPEEHVRVYEDGSEQLPLPMYTETDVDAEIEYPDEHVRFLAGACNYSFSNVEMEVICNAIVKAVPVASKFGYGLDTDRYDYLSDLYKQLVMREQRKDLKPLSNRVKYLLGMIDNMS